MTVVASWLWPRPETWQHLADTVLADYILNSLGLVMGVSIGVLLLGPVPAWLVTMYRFPASRQLEWALLLPLAMPAYIIAYTYTGLLDVGGPVQSFIRDSLGYSYGDYWFPPIRSLGGAIVMLSLVLYPYVYLLTRTAFIEQSVCVLEVARTLGLSPARRFLRVALPLARPAIIAGLSLVLMETLADYGTVQYFGVSVFTTGIFRTWFGLADGLAAAQLATLLLVFIVVLIGLEQHSRRAARYHHTSNRYAAIVAQRLYGWRAAVAFTVCAVPVVFGFLLPAGLLLNWAIDSWPRIDQAGFLRLMGHSLGLAVFTAVLAVALALFFAYGRRLYDNIGTRLSVRFVGLGYAIPGTVIAVGALLPFAWFDNALDTWLRAQFGISSGLLLSGSLFTLVFAYLVRFLAVSTNTIEAGLAKIRPSMDEAARSMGLQRWAVLRRVHMPMLRGTLLTALLLVFVDVLKELPATLLLRPFNFNTLAVRTYELANDERLYEAACSALAIVAVGIIPVIILSRIISQSRPGHDGEA
ncbi:ABC transporter permease [Methylohalomonas lacus]|nr:iron ABC transporter permease [Methylohalomonas lacus]